MTIGTQDLSARGFDIATCLWIAFCQNGEENPGSRLRRLFRANDLGNLQNRKFQIFCLGHRE